MVLIKDAIFNVFDIETTGLSSDTDRVVEIARVLMSLDGGILSRWNSLVCPGVPIPAEASAVHHLVDEDVANAPQLEEVLPSLRGGVFHAVAAHNAVFDTSFIPFDDKPVLCSRRLALKLWPDLEYSGNQYLRYHFKLQCPEAKGIAAHRAEADAIVTARLLQFELRNVLSRAKDPDQATVENLVAWVNTPTLLRICPFGKHKGTAFADIPRDYFEWMARTMTDMDVDLRFTVDHYLKMK